jgi:hypothetical protein
MAAFPLMLVPTLSASTASSVGLDASAGTATADGTGSP